MGDNIKVNDEASQPQLSIGAQGLGGMEEVEEAMKRLRICPRKVLELLGHLRIEKTQIKPLEDKGPKAGGNADVEAAILVPPEQSSTSLPPGDEEYVAVKKLRFDTDTDDDRVLAPFAHEVNLLNDLSHPNVVKVVGFVEDVEQGIAWMVFFWEKNGNLREFVRSANWELPERVSLINDVIEGLSYLHGRDPPICHGDLKSLNILVNSGSRAIITDFGSARTVDSATEQAVRGLDPSTPPTFQHRTPTGAPTIESLKAEISASGDSITMTGPAWTIRWAAPELLEGELSSLASDVWALGWICWEAVTGNFPFEEENDVSIVLRITRGDLPAVSDHAQLKQVQELCSLIGECWRLDANKRPTAIRCQQVTSFMDRSIPSNNEGSLLATTRSSGLLFALGRIQMKNDRLHEAQKYFQQSFEVAKSVGDKRGWARALKAQGDLYHLRNEHSNAEKSYIQARDIFSQIGSRLGIAYSVKGLAHVYYKRGEHSKAEASYIQARDIFSQMGDQLGFAQSVKGLGQVYYMRKEYSKAEDSYIQARDMYFQIGYQLGFARSLEDLGYVSYIRNEYSKAEDSFIQARDIYSRIGSQLDFANSVQALGRLYSAQGQDVKAEDPYLQAQAVYRRTGRVRPLANNLWLLACLRRRQARYGDVERLVCEASTLYGKLGMKGHVADCDAFLKEVRQLRAMSRGRISPR